MSGAGAVREQYISDTGTGAWQTGAWCVSYSYIASHEAHCWQPKLPLHCLLYITVCTPAHGNSAG